MDHVKGMGGYSSSGRWKGKGLNHKGKKALASLTIEEVSEALLEVHEENSALQMLGERLKDVYGVEQQGSAEFSMDSESGEVIVRLYDPKSEVIVVKLSLEELTKALKSLEESDDVQKPLSSFFLNTVV